MPPAKHNPKYSSSKASIWTVCSLATLLNSGPSEETEVMRYGTQCHSLAEALIRKALNIKNFDEDDVPIDELKKSLDLFDEDMEQTAENYCTFVVNQYDFEKARSFNSPIIYLEQFLELEVPEFKEFLSGTMDCGIYSDADGGTLTIIDLKTGRSPVYAFNKETNKPNEQESLYALFFYEVLLKGIYPVKKVRLEIFQPLIKNTNSYEMTIEDLLKFKEEVILPAIARSKAEHLEGVPGPHCRWCQGRFNCVKRMEMNTQIDTKVDVTKISDEQLELLLPKLEELKRYADDVMAYAVKRAKEGYKFKSYKLVYSKVTRKISDEAKVAEIVKAEGIDPYGPGKLLGITELTKKLGKNRFNELISPFITKQESSLILVPNQDPREEVNVNQIQEEQNNED